MNESFNKFKKKMLLEAIIKSVATGLAVGIILFTVPYLIINIGKIELAKINLLFLGIGSISLAIIVFGILFLILYPRNLKVAKRLDKELNLKQKVQTMIEYENVDTPMTSLQREDTINTLSNISIKKFVMKFSVFFFVLVGFASLLGVTSIVMASIDDEIVDNSNDDEDKGPAYDLDNWTVRALLDLIEVVETSNINNELKTPVVNDLNSLLDSLETVEYQSEMKGLVENVINNSSIKLDLINSNNEVFTILRTSTSDIVSGLGTHINALNVDNVNNSIENLYIYLTGDSETIIGALQEFDNDFRVLIKNSVLNKEEPLVKALYKFAEDLKQCENSANLYESIAAVIDTNKPVIIDIIRQQAENKVIIEYVIEQLEIIFGLKETENEDGTNSDTNNGQINPTEPPKISDDDNSGGYGTGEVLFGSDDVMFDIEEGVIKYGDVIAKYYGDLVGKFNDGTLPEEYKEFFDKYFNELFGFEENEETE